MAGPLPHSKIFRIKPNILYGGKLQMNGQILQPSTPLQPSSFHLPSLELLWTLSLSHSRCELSQLGVPKGAYCKMRCNAYTKQTFLTHSMERTVETIQIWASKKWSISWTSPFQTPWWKNKSWCSSKEHAKSFRSITPSRKVILPCILNVSVQERSHSS